MSRLTTRSSGPAHCHHGRASGHHNHCRRPRAFGGACRPLNASVSRHQVVVGTDTSAFLLGYAHDLLQRSGQGVSLPFRPGTLDDWSAEEHQCHANAEEWCARNPGHTIVRGWLYFSFHGVMPFVRFSAHSVVKLPDGTLRDITPSEASMPYPFLFARESQDEYDRWVRGSGIMHLDYYVGDRRVIPLGIAQGDIGAG